MLSFNHGWVKAPTRVFSVSKPITTTNGGLLAVFCTALYCLPRRWGEGGEKVVFVDGNGALVPTF